MSKPNICVHIPPCLWDRICFLPLLLKRKSEWKKITLFEYEKKYFGVINSNLNEILKFYKKNNLYDNILTIPYNKFQLLITILKNFKKYNIFYTATKTITTTFFWNILAKRFIYVFKNRNDNLLYDNYLSWMLKTNIDFYKFKNNISIPYNSWYKGKYRISKKFVTIFVGPFLRSIDKDERNKLFLYLDNVWFDLVLLWSNSKNREWWIQKYLPKKVHIINLLWKTNFEEVCSIISDANFTISANWWIMWLSHFLNEKAISFSTCSWKITHPPVNNITSFHLMNNLCNAPCEGFINEDEYNIDWCKICKFYKTEKECCCKKNITSENIIDIIKKHF
jgi:ADP-heptose:LPS heptosyltransferase